MNARSVFIDRAVLRIYNVRFRCKSQSEFLSFKQRLCDDLYSIRQSSTRYAKFRTKKGLGFSSHKTEVWFNEVAEEVSLATDVRFNPVKRLSAYFSQFLDEPPAKALDGNTNYIPENFLEDLGQEDLSDRCLEELVDQIEQLVLDIRACAQFSLSEGGNLLIDPEVSIQEIEITKDSLSGDAVRAVESLRSGFLKLFARVGHVAYEPACGESSENNAVVLKGWRNKDESYKMYAKTKAILRYEATYKKDKLRKICATNRVTPPLYEGFAQYLEELAPVADVIYSALPHSAPKPLRSERLVSLISGIHRAVKDEEVMATMVALVQRGAISTKGFDSRILDRLVRGGVVHRVGWGMYAMEEGDHKQLQDFLAYVQKFSCAESEDSDAKN